MRHFLIKLLAFSALAFPASDRAWGFALGGLKPPWQTETVGFEEGLLIAPMNINEEYRWNVPQVYYGYTAGFLSYFGEEGINSIEEAFAILNALPSSDDLNIDDYPTESGRMNLRASALGLTDIKSTALSFLLHAMGLTDPTRYAFVIRNRWIGPPGITNYLVIKRNFDPVTFQHSPYVNGSLWTYIIEEPFRGDNTAWARNFPVDPLEQLFPRTLPVASDTAGLYGIPSGFFWTKLTRDDVAGLKYIYRPSNYNLENTLESVSGGAVGGGDPTTGTGGQLGFPGGGGAYDFPSGSVGVGGGIYDFPFNTFTNAGVNVGGGQDVGGGDTGGDGGVGAFLRGGLGKLQFTRVNYDSLLGGFTPLIDRFTDTIFTNGRSRSQSLNRVLLQPDIIFDAADLQGGDAGGPFVVLERAVTEWSNSDPLDGEEGDDYGPGVIVPSLSLVFNTIGPSARHNQFFLTEDSALFLNPVWGSFDGSTNDPIVYPIGTSIIELEQQVGVGGR